ADNVESGEEGHEVVSTVENFAAVRDALEARFGEAESARLVWLPQNSVPVTDDDAAKSLLKLIDVLEDNDDVQNVFANFDMPAEMIERLSP
ncbi:MAG TPA: YebC/PmpR family DNA-binding transcriptional regulator, partial [Alphaproteobacteria bacterium]|nr:YebC/PmpR family DNA-binding transcriptional regulator [Alphaproteobacteria bacterium]